MTSRVLNQSISHNRLKAVSMHIPSSDLPLARDLNHIFSSDAIFIGIILLLKCLPNEIFYLFLAKEYKKFGRLLSTMSQYLSSRVKEL